MILHIVEKDIWEDLLLFENYTSNNLNREKFIHGSSAHNIEFVAPHFINDKEYVILVIDEHLLSSEVRYEDDGNYGTKYPHIYGPINIDSVVDVLPFVVDKNTFCLNSDLRNLIEVKIVDYNDKYFDEIVELFKTTVLNINSKDYTTNELKVWITINKDSWRKSLKANICKVALIEKDVVGFGDITEDGYLDRLYVKDKFINQYVGSKLVQSVESAVDKGVIHTYASITAKAFFLKHGYTVVRENYVIRDGEELKNFLMEKKI